MENWVKLSHLFVIMFLSEFAGRMVNPVITDVTVEAVCGGKEECSLAIYLSGIQQAVLGLAAVVMMPLIGNLSDVYGRKALLTIILTLSIIPYAILAWSTMTNFFYAYYVFKILTGMVTGGGVMCISLAYLADNVPEGKRVFVFGVLTGLVSIANFGGTMAARLFSTIRIFQVAAAMSIVATVYMRIFFNETIHQTSSLDEPILDSVVETNQDGCEPSNNEISMKKLTSPNDVIRLFKRSTTLSLVACISFLESLAEASAVAYLLYFLKARFHFMKDQFADILLITYVSSTVSSMILLPILGPFIGDGALLSLGLFGGFLNMLFDSIAWSSWVPYASGALALFFALVSPTVKSMVSKQIGPNEQGIAQGCILSIASLGSLASPIIYGPISALFLSEDAPFDFPGFSILCIGFAYLIGFILSIVILIQNKKVRNKDNTLV